MSRSRRELSDENLRLHAELAALRNRPNMVRTDTNDPPAIATLRADNANLYIERDDLLRENRELVAKLEEALSELARFRGNCMEFSLLAGTVASALFPGEDFDGSNTPIADLAQRMVAKAKGLREDQLSRHRKMGDMGRRIVQLEAECGRLEKRVAELGYELSIRLGQP